MRIRNEARRCIALLLAACLLLSLAACGGGGTDADEPSPETASESTPEPTSEPTPKPTPEPTPKPDPVEEALGQYRLIAGHPDAYDYGASPSGAVSYQYALVLMHPEDAVPTLLLKQSYEGELSELSYVRVFKCDPENRTVYQPDNVTLSIGIEGTRIFSLAMWGDGNGLYTCDWSRANGDMTVYRVTLDGDSLAMTQEWTGTFGSGEPASTLIDWHDITDLSGLDVWPPDEDTSASQTEPEQASIPETLPVDGNRIVFTGTLGIYSYNEVLALQGESDPNPGNHSGESFQLIILDTPQVMGLSSIGDPGFLYERMVSMVAVSGLGQYEGQHLIFSIDPYEACWPSDTSLPLGQPRADDVHVLG